MDYNKNLKDFTAKMLEKFKIIDIAWFINLNQDRNGPMKPISFSNTVSIIIQAQFLKYMKSNGAADKRLVHCGVITVDLLKMEMYNTKDPKNKTKRFQVIQGQKTYRVRADGKKKFGEDILGS